jgi:hypothetical protein
LEAFVKEGTPTPPDIITVGNLIKIIFSTTFTLASETILAETGIRFAGALTKTVAEADKYLLTRDDLDPARVMV